MNEWTPSVDPAYLEKKIQKGAATIVILRPVVDDEEKIRRESKTRTTLEGVMRDYFHRRIKTT